MQHYFAVERCCRKLSSQAAPVMLGAPIMHAASLPSSAAHDGSPVLHSCSSSPKTFLMWFGRSMLSVKHHPLTCFPHS